MVKGSWRVFLSEWKAEEGQEGRLQRLPAVGALAPVKRGPLDSGRRVVACGF